jgi:hypothetical protein
MSHPMRLPSRYDEMDITRLIAATYTTALALRRDPAASATEVMLADALAAVPVALGKSLGPILRVAGSYADIVRAINGLIDDIFAAMLKGEGK